MTLLLLYLLHNIDEGVIFKEEKGMKKIKSIKGLLAVLLAIVIIGTTANVAHAYPLYREPTQERIDELKERDITVHWEMGGSYVAQFVKLYGREVKGVDENGNFIFGEWELLDERDKAYLGNEGEVRVPATYHEFAFSFDVMWGTDFPFSGYVYSVKDEDVSYINLEMGGMVRSASLHMWTPEWGTAFIELNLPSHTEWKPN